MATFWLEYCYCIVRWRTFTIIIIVIIIINFVIIIIIIIIIIITIIELSKIFERVMFTQLYSYFNINNLLSEQQYGFRSQHSTEFACVKLVDYIIKEMDNIKDIKIPASIF